MPSFAMNWIEGGDILRGSMEDNKMSLINYVEPINIGSVFVGLGGLFLTLVLGYIFYRIYVKLAQYIDVLINREAKYELLEECMLDRVGEKSGIDLDKELIKRKMFSSPKKKSFRRKIEEQIYEEMFGKDKK